MSYVVFDYLYPCKTYDSSFYPPLTESFKTTPGPPVFPIDVNIPERERRGILGYIMKKLKKGRAHKIPLYFIGFI